jgi:hypothetical protein
LAEAHRQAAPLTLESEKNLVDEVPLPLLREEFLDVGGEKHSNQLVIGHVGRLPILYHHEGAQGSVVTIADDPIAKLVFPSPRQDERGLLFVPTKVKEDIEVVLSDSYREREVPTGSSHAAVESAEKRLRRIQEIGLQVLSLLYFSQFFPPEFITKKERKYSSRTY